MVEAELLLLWLLLACNQIIEIEIIGIMIENLRNFAPPRAREKMLPPLRSPTIAHVGGGTDKEAQTIEGGGNSLLSQGRGCLE